MPPTPLRLSFLGFNPFGGGYDGRGLIDAGADRTFASLDTLGAMRLVRRHFGLGSRPKGGHASVLRTIATGEAAFDLRITGYSFGGWSALQLAHALAPFGRRLRVRIGLVDPVGTFRPARAWRVGLGKGVAPWWPVGGAAYATRPPHVVWAENVYETHGLVARTNGGTGRRKPYPARWFASGPVAGFDNRDVTAEVSTAAGHIEVLERYGQAVAAATFAEA
ncbi:MAG: hypothetical protein JWO31_3887 [Phycisphaerales bacterium]|nr:hypothetical protein [Phycisphaerales bacterium]